MMQKENAGFSGSEPAAGFKESAVFTFTAILVGMVIELFTSGSGFNFPGWPFNLIFLIVFAVLILAMGLLFRERPLMAWLGGIPMGLCLIVGLALLSLVGGVIPQDLYPPDSVVAVLRLNGMFSSWPFALVVLLFLFNLGLSLVWKVVPFKLSNLQFILFHGGFWIALACGLAGATQLQRMVVPTYEGRASNTAYEPAEKGSVTLPFSIELNDFQIDQYVSQFALYDPRHDRIIETRSKLVPEVRKGVKAEWPGIGTVTVLDYLPNALPDAQGDPVEVDGHNGVRFAKVRVETASRIAEYWISSGGPKVKPEFVPMGDYFIVMADGPPKAFRSKVTIIADDGERKVATLEVNKPVDFKGWKLYQMGYDEKAGRWSTLSLVEVVRDPWLSVVYTGFFMIMAGNVLFFWKGIKRMEEA
ncbi:MAG TPA: cytochrome c biogenesis protein [Chlorobaculum parvum]|uniref:Cytochrome c biogenesis protein n=1 Tax=Chlorobaculum parvum TaxID=274539 RepID=A0A7C5HFC1_9CHLB|nr:cytochrome c biogenesis protein [Chlorobaculum parvum]